MKSLSLFAVFVFAATWYGVQGFAANLATLAGL